jgi:hypothetical protein
VESLSQPHWEALTPATIQALHKVANLYFIDQFYLAGGTGLALYLGHRFSVDIDFFSPDISAAGPDQRDALRNILSDPSLAVTYDKEGTFVATWQQVGVSFFRLAVYPLVKVPLLVEGIRLARLEEIGAMKLAAIIDRGTRKDFVDMYFILKIISLEEVFEVASIKYAQVHSFPVSAVRALAYFIDAEALPMPRMLDHTSWATMKKFLEHQAMEAGRMRLEDLWTLQK